LEASATIWFGSLTSAGSITTRRACLDYGRSIFDVVEGVKPSDVVRWLLMSGFRSLNVAGHLESSNPGIGVRVERFILEVFRRFNGLRLSLNHSSVVLDTASRYSINS
jgi:Circularly permutated YpsA SLOG family